jgi:hypothetical protein
VETNWAGQANEPKMLWCQENWECQVELDPQADCGRVKDSTYDWVDCTLGPVGDGSHSWIASKSIARRPSV